MRVTELTAVQVTAQAYGTVAKLCCHNEQQHAALCSLAAVGPDPRSTTSLKLARIACLAHHGKVPPLALSGAVPALLLNAFMSPQVYGIEDLHVSGCINVRKDTASATVEIFLTGRLRCPLSMCFQSLQHVANQSMLMRLSASAA